MITLNDATERARLAADETGLLSQTMYNMIVAQLSDAESYAFTLALVDLGIQTKRGTVESEEIVSNVLDKRSQTFKQTPGGIWAPDTWTDNTSEPQQDDEQPVEDTQTEMDFTPQEPEQSEPVEELPDYSSQITALENAGIRVDSSGNVKFFKATVPGLFTNQIPVKPVSFDKAIEMFERNVDTVDREQQRIADLQDILAALKSDFSGLGSNVQGVIDEFNDAVANLDKYKYSEKSPNQDVAEVARGLTTIKQFLNESGPSVDDLQAGLSSHTTLINNLQKNLDNYYELQYSTYDDKSKILYALQNLSDLMNENPELFGQVVGNMGGIVGKFLSWRN